MNPAFVLGQLFLWAGFLGGSYAAVCRPERTDAPWQTIPWNAYALSLGVGIAGVVLLRRDKAAQQRSAAESATGIEGLRTTLAAAARQTADLRDRLPNLTCEELLEAIDTQCVPLLAEFADARTAILHRFGSAVYAEVMTEFASGERYLNRAWSAAADGYVDEVARSMEAAATFLIAASERLQRVGIESVSES